MQPSRGCASAVVGLCDNRRCGSRRRAACRCASAVAWLHRQPSPGCSPLCSRREAARQSSLGCVSTAAWPSSGCLLVQPPPGYVTTVIVVAVTGLPVCSCQPSPGCSPLFSRRQAVCQSSQGCLPMQPSPGCVTTVSVAAIAGLLAGSCQPLSGRRWAAYVSAAARPRTTVIVVAVAGLHRQPSPGCSPLCSRREAACQPSHGRR